MKGDPTTTSVNISLAAFPGLRHDKAAQAAISGARAGLLCEPLFGAVRADHVQLVPQNMGLLDVNLCESLLAAYPATRFRLHANVRVLAKHTMADLSGVAQHRQWFEQAARISRALKAPAYTAHAGSRGECTMAEMLENARRLADLFECPVGVEGQYPVTGNHLLVTSWDEYREVFESGVPYALDLSHLNILAHQSGSREVGLVQEMLSCERCIEVHVSDNNGTGDWHRVCERKTWWHPLLPSINHGAVIFTEGNHRRLHKDYQNAK